MNQTESLKKTYNVAFIVNVAIIGTLILYAVVIEILRRQLAPFQGLMEISNVTLLRYILYGIAILNIFLIRIMRRLLLRKPPSEKFNLLKFKLLKTSLVTAALCEIPAILGLILFLLIGSVRDYYQLAGVSFILVFLHFPRYGNWEAWTKNTDKSLSSCG
ncbi:MAG: hypothetical protein OEZ45_05090 [Candidatus Aminicenantes bacterium]|nr:hypothetical protein [Candidatus Aminicenantes bacterium]